MSERCGNQSESRKISKEAQAIAVLTMSQFDSLPDDTIARLRDSAEELLLWQLVLLALWFMVFILRQLCDWMLEISFGWLLGSIRRSVGVGSKSSSLGRKKKVRLRARGLIGKEIHISEGSRTTKVDADKQVWCEYFSNPSQW